MERSLLVTLLVAATLAIAPSATASLDVDPKDGEVVLAADDLGDDGGIDCRPYCLPDPGDPGDELLGDDDDPEEEEDERHCRPYCLPVSQAPFTVTVQTPTGEAQLVVHPIQLDDDSPTDLLPGDPEEEEENSPCNPHCLPLSVEDGEVGVDGSIAEVTIVAEPVALSDDPLQDLLPGDDPEEEEEGGNPCDPHC